MSSFALDLMIDLTDEEIEALFEYRQMRLKELLKIQFDLVYYAHFSAADIEKFKVIERRYFITEINEIAKQLKNVTNK